MSHGEAWPVRLSFYYVSKGVPHAFEVGKCAMHGTACIIWVDLSATMQVAWHPKGRWKLRDGPS